MQPIPLRLSQAIRTTFQTSRPSSRPFRSLASTREPRRRLVQPCLQNRVGAQLQARFYSDSRKDIDIKVEEVKGRIDDTLGARADHVNPEPPKPDQTAGSETIIHTNPEASSIVHSKTTSEGPKPSSYTSKPSTPPDPTLPSSKTSPITARLSHLMDNLQSNLFVASRRLNDLTGYTGIQRLKDEITAQEDLVTSNRSAVKAARAAYSSAIATRSTTQREVNDLLHRKHTWTAGDLERFTSLYRSDHANERAEEAAQQTLSAAESAYEEASTKLARTILARYHEEQIWSDKIRQMSTWGTWGLMGLNVLLFVLFQIAIEPWRRRRLVRGFEEKVQEALKEVGDKAAAGAVAGEVKIVVPEAEGQRVADGLATAIIDAVSGAAPTAAAEQIQAGIEAAIEHVNAIESTNEHAGDDLSFPNPSIGKDSSSSFARATASGFAYYQEAFAELFSEQRVVLTQRELTTVALEGVAGGAAFMGFLFVLFRPR